MVNVVKLLIVKISSKATKKHSTLCAVHKIPHLIQFQLLLCCLVWNKNPLIIRFVKISGLTLKEDWVEPCLKEQIHSRAKPSLPHLHSE